MSPLPRLSEPVNGLVGLDVTEEMIELARASPAAGCFVEVGVFQGGTAQYLHALAWEQRRNLYLYDTFTGIPFADPDKGDSHRVGEFADTSFEALQKLCPYAMIVAGVFPGSAVEMPPVAFAHLDCDQYRSITESVTHLAPLMMAGGLIWFDDSPVLDGARRATRELFGELLQLSRTGRHFVRY